MACRLMGIGVGCARTLLDRTSDRPSCKGEREISSGWFRRRGLGSERQWRWRQWWLLAFVQITVQTKLLSSGRFACVCTPETGKQFEFSFSTPTIGVSIVLTLSLSLPPSLLRRLPQSPFHFGARSFVRSWVGSCMCVCVITSDRSAVRPLSAHIAHIIHTQALGWAEGGLVAPSQRHRVCACSSEFE